ncbi:cation transporter, partial [Escherichia coli]|uniref:cation transporter n=1 Tax=Escherichia coli TaxID=562 RepID=UPI0034D714D2
MAVTICVAGFGVIFGLLAGSFSIVFDGVYMLADAAMSGLALGVARLIALSAVPTGKLRERFTMGFWHLE